MLSFQAELGSGKAKAAVISVPSQKSAVKGRKRASDAGADEAPRKKPRANKKQVSEDKKVSFSCTLSSVGRSLNLYKQRKRKSKDVEKGASPVPVGNYFV